VAVARGLTGPAAVACNRFGLSAWESDRITPPEGLTSQYDCPQLPLADSWSLGLNGPPMARVILAARRPAAYCRGLSDLDA
jgi:hypothetical protein